MPRANDKGKVQNHSKVKVGSAVVVVGLAAVMVWGLWVSASGGPSNEPSAVEVPTEALPSEGALAEVRSETETFSVWDFEALGSDDPSVVAAAAVELRDEWFFEDNDPLVESVEVVFGSAIAPGATSMLNEMAAQRASLWDAPEPNKTYYHSAVLSVANLGETADGDVLIEVWAVEVISRRNLIEPVSQWTRERITMRWNPLVERWNVQEWRTVEGPTPTLLPQASPSTASELEFDLEGHGRVRDWLGLVEEEVTQ